MRFGRVWSLSYVVVCAFAAFVAGCSGGGGSPPAVSPTPTANASATLTPTPYPTASGPMATFSPRTSASGVTLSTYALQSNPSGLAVTINGVASGTTPSTSSPGFATGLTTYSIASTNGNSPFAYIADQTANGNHTIYYNQQFDINGAITSIATSAIERASPERIAHARLDAAGEPHFVPSSFRHAPGLSATRLAVRYRVDTLRSSGRDVVLAERAFGVARALDIGPQTLTERTRILDVPAGVSITALQAKIANDPAVEWVGPLHLRYPSSAVPVTPNDTHFDNYQQWDMFQIQSIVNSGTYATNAWGYTLGKKSINIAIIDTGADLNHADLASKLTYGEKVLNGTITYGLAAVQDTDGHGTNVAGIAAADTNNGFGFAGTGYNTSLQIYKVFPDVASPTVDSGDEAQAIYDAVAHGANVINLSLGGTQDAGFDPVERDAIEYAIAHGVSVVAASGNERTNGSTTVNYPAAFPGVISVGATALNDSANANVAKLAMEYVPGYSSSGPELTLVAPGGDPSSTSDPDLLHWTYNIYTTTPLDPKNACKNINDCKALFAGTSQATPHVSGAIALMLALDSTLTPARITQILESTADDLGDPYQGHGRLNVYRALAAVESDSISLPKPSGVNFRAFAYTVSPGSRTPTILDVTYPNGIPVSSSGTYRIADILANATNFKIGIWDDVNGDGIVDAGDYFGSSSTCANAISACAGATSITVHPITSSFVLQ